MPRSIPPAFPGPIPPLQTADGLIDHETYRRSDGSFPERDGTNPIERMALHRVRLDIAAMPASQVVQLALWPTELRTLAERGKRSPALIYNTLNCNNRRPYHAVRNLIAEVLLEVAVLHEAAELEMQIGKAAVDHLIDAPTAEPHGREPIRAPGRRTDPLALPDAPAFDPSRPTASRDGTNPIEQLALRVAYRYIAAIPASEVVQLALWPRSLREWTEEAGHEENIYNMLAWRNHFAYRPIRRHLAKTLGVSEFALDWLVEAATAPAPRITSDRLHTVQRKPPTRPRHHPRALQGTLALE